jgi:hypothetical protein
LKLQECGALMHRKGAFHKGNALHLSKKLWQRETLTEWGAAILQAKSNRHENELYTLRIKM